MAKRKHTYWLEDETHTLIEAEAERLTVEYGKKVGQADVIGLAIVKWCMGDSEGTSTILSVPDQSETRRAVAEAVIKTVEAKPVVVDEKPKARAESVAQRKAREAAEHAAKLAEGDVVARMAGREDIEYDLENVVSRGVLPIGLKGVGREQRHYEVAQKSVKVLNRPNGSTEAKRRREQ